MATYQIDEAHTNATRIELGYKSSRNACRAMFADFVWAAGNLPARQRQGILALGNYLIECIDLLDLESVDGTSLDVWHEVRDDLADALDGRPSTPTRAALMDTVNRFKIPHEHLFEMLDGADTWICNRRFETFDQTLSFTEKFGGNMLAACVPVLGFLERDYQPLAIKCGQAIHLTQILANLLPDLKEHKSFLAKEDYTKCEIDMARLQMRRPGKQFRHFVRQHTSRIERLFIEGGKLVGFLDYSGARTISSILDYHWKMFTKMRAEPELIYGMEKVLSRKDKFKLRTRHVMGLEGKSPVIDRGEEHHH